MVALSLSRTADRAQAARSLHHYEIDAEPADDGVTAYARAVYNYRWTPQRDPFGVLHPTIYYPGVPVDHSPVVEDHNTSRT